uniref:Uncharacterized protein n=1 Tax=Macrostomum lignano TaxID=282301 RepID=A0A1I8FJU1_9PLAT
MRLRLRMIRPPLPRRRRTRLGRPWPASWSRSGQPSAGRRRS